MLATLRKHELEVLLALVAAVALYFGVQGGLAWRDARASYQDAVDTQHLLEAQAAQYDLDALTSQRDSLRASANDGVFPTLDDVESSIESITSLLSDSNVTLESLDQGDIEEEVTDQDVGATGDASRTYQAVELSLTLTGNVDDLLNVAELLLAAAPNATFGDVAVTIGTDSEPSSLLLRVLLYYKD